MKNKLLAESELVLNKDGSIYHLNLTPDDLADTVITVGDPARVPIVSAYFDRIELKRQKREIVTHTGWIGNKRITVISTGMGIGSIDIVITELDALVNVDFQTRQIRENPRQLNIIRLGTCGGLQADLPVDSIVVTSGGFGFDNLLQSYVYTNNDEEIALLQALDEQLDDEAIKPYVFLADPTLVDCLGKDYATGLTATCAGFYGPQCRTIRAELRNPQLLQQLQLFRHNDKQVLTFEMETTAMLGFGRLFQHRCCSASVIVANRAKQVFSSNLQTSVKNMIEVMLARIETL